LGVAWAGVSGAVARLTARPGLGGVLARGAVMRAAIDAGAVTSGAVPRTALAGTMPGRAMAAGSAMAGGTVAGGAVVVRTMVGLAATGRGVDRVEELKDLVQRGNPEDPQERVPRADNAEASVRRANPALRTY